MVLRGADPGPGSGEGRAVPESEPARVSAEGREPIKLTGPAAWETLEHKAHTNSKFFTAP